MLFNLNFANNTILSFFFFFFFLIIGLYFLIPIIAQIFNPIAKRVISIRIPTKKVKAEMETDTVTVEIKISKCSI